MVDSAPAILEVLVSQGVEICVVLALSLDNMSYQDLMLKFYFNLDTIECKCILRLNWS